MLNDKNLKSKNGKNNTILNKNNNFYWVKKEVNLVQKKHQFYQFCYISPKVKYKLTVYSYERKTQDLKYPTIYIWKT